MATIVDRDRLLGRVDAVIDLSLTLEAGSNILHSTEAILAGKAVKFVTISVQRSFSSRWRSDQENIRAFFRAIGCLPQLESLRLSATSFGSPVDIPASMLVATLENCCRLERFQIYGMNIVMGNRGDKEALAATFRKHSCLSEVSFVRCLSEGLFETEVENGLFEIVRVEPYPELFSAMASMPKLERLEVHYREINKSRSGASRVPAPTNLLAEFGQAPKLTLLEFLNYDINHTQLQALADNFHSFRNLEELSLSCLDVLVNSFQALAQILATRSNLQKLHLEPLHGCPIIDSMCTDLLTDALAHNAYSQLKALVLDKSLVVSLKGFVKLLRINCRLQTLAIKALMPSVWDSVEMTTLLKLNEIGRYSLFQETTSSSRAQWVEALIRAQGDIHCLFYLLSANPSLCRYYDE